MNAACAPAPTDYTLALAPGRRTADPTKRWLYPDSTLTVTVDAPRLQLTRTVTGAPCPATRSRAALGAPPFDWMVNRANPDTRSP
ncbi:MAG: hypothetical protein EXR69_10630 [Myxococcales bacterium]|nr:hypothetical protein [Myxococcales bacterium]